MNDSDINLSQDMFWGNDTFEYYDFGNDTNQACYGASDKVCGNIFSLYMNKVPLRLYYEYILIIPFENFNITR